jgi:hypothetical protein
MIPACIERERAVVGTAGLPFGTPGGNLLRISRTYRVVTQRFGVGNQQLWLLRLFECGAFSATKQTDPSPKPREQRARRVTVLSHSEPRLRATSMQASVGDLDRFWLGLPI